MRTIARTPEELETLFEDALVVRDREAINELFDQGAVLVHGDQDFSLRGEDPAEKAMAIWSDGDTYIADPQHVIQSRDIAVIVVKNGVNVASRGRDGAWRYAIMFLTVEV
jgi:hypothetical protein